MSLGPLITAFVQLAAVPLLLYTWGAAKYGDWLLLSAIPSYLGLSDLGFGDASGSDMTVKVAAGDRDGALRTFQSSWVLLSSVSFAVLLIASCVVWFLPWLRWLHVSGLSHLEASAIIITLGVYVLVSQQSGIFESGFRCDGNFALGTLLGNLIRLSESVTATAVGILSGSLFWTAVTYLAVRATGVLVYAALLRRKSPWLKFGSRHADVACIKQLAGPALGFVALPASYALSLQGFTIIIGAIMGPIAVTAFSTLRTLTRVSFQFLGIVANTLWPELSAAFGRGDVPLARKLHRHAYQAGLFISASVAIFLWATGPTIYHLWVRGAVHFDASAFHILLFVTIVNSLWYTSSVVPMATNAHNRIALIYLAITTGSLVGAWGLIPVFGLKGAAWALFSIDACMSWVVLRTSLRLVQDNASDFFFAVFTSFPLREVFGARGRKVQEVPV